MALLAVIATLDTAVEIMLTPLEDADAPPISFAARVIRIDHDAERPGFGLAIELIDDAAGTALEGLLGEDYAED